MASGPWEALFARGDAYHGAAPLPFFASSLQPGARVLDLGCGAGKSLRPLAAQPWRVLGLDASSAALPRARALAPVTRADAGALPLRGASFDAARACHLLGHLDEAALHGAAAELARVLAPGGMFEARDFAEGDLREGTGRRVGARRWERGGVATHYFAPRELGSVFAERGFVCEEHVEERAVRFAEQPRRVVVLRARRRHGARCEKSYLDKVGRHERI